MALVEAGTSGLQTRLVPSSPPCAGPRGGRQLPCSQAPAQGKPGQASRGCTVLRTLRPCLGAGGGAERPSGRQQEPCLCSGG